MRICIDMDGVMVDFVSRALKVAKKRFGIEANYEDIKEMRMAKFIIDNMTEEKKAELKIDHDNFIGLEREETIYDHMCPRGFFYKARPYKGAVQAVRDLVEAGHEIVFLTKPLNWKYSTEEKMDWLLKYFRDLIDQEKCCVFMLNKTQNKHLIHADLWIDDDPRALTELDVTEAVCVRQPWNEEYRMKEFKGLEVDSLKEFADAMCDTKKWEDLLSR
jgi:5'(3')-deoxyribonucleotidase